MGYYSCPVCEKQTISSIKDLQLRIASALSSTLKCPFCSSNLNGLSSLHSHIWECHMTVNCSNSLTENNHLPIEQIPSIEKLDIRDECHTSVLNVSSVHYNCNLCGLVFSSEYFLNIHKEIIHSHTGSFEISCKLCKSKFNDLEIYRNHVNEIHSGQRYFCQQCPKSFKMKGGLLVHTRMCHDQNSPNYCKLCKKSFANKARKEVHDKKYHPDKEIVNIPEVSSMDATGNQIGSQFTPNQLVTKEHNNNASNLMLQNIEVSNQQIGINVSSTEEQVGNYYLNFITKTKSDAYDDRLLLCKETGSLQEVKTQNIIINCNSELDDINSKRRRIDINAVSISPTVQTDSIDSSAMEIPIIYPKKIINPSGFTENNNHSSNITQERKAIQEYLSTPLYENIPNNSTAFNSSGYTSTENMESDDSKLFEMLLWSNTTSPTSNNNINSTSDSKITLQSQSRESTLFSLPRDRDQSLESTLIKSHSTMVAESAFSSERNSIINLSPKNYDKKNSPKMKDESPKSNENKTWQCEECKKSFTTKYFLKKHKRLHTGETPYSCAECGKTFTFQQSYHKHVFYHTNDKPHRCPQCGRAFKEMSTLHNHIRIHTGEKPFICDTCGKAFRQRVSYLVHQRIHNGHMPYACDTCKKPFRYKVSLRSHKCPMMSNRLKESENPPRRESFSSVYANSEAFKCTSVGGQLPEDSTSIESPNRNQYSSTPMIPLCNTPDTSLTTDFDKDLFINSLFN